MVIVAQNIMHQRCTMDTPDKVPMCLNNQHVKAATGYLNEGSCVHKCMQHGCTRIPEDRYLKMVCSRAPPGYLTVDFFLYVYKAEKPSYTNIPEKWLLVACVAWNSAASG